MKGIRLIKEVFPNHVSIKAPNELTVLLYLKGCADENGLICQPLRQIVKGTGVRFRGVTGALRALRDKGYLRFTGEKVNGVPIRQLFIPPLVLAQEEPKPKPRRTPMVAKPTEPQVQAPEPPPGGNGRGNVAAVKAMLAEQFGVTPESLGDGAVIMVVLNG